MITIRNITKVIFSIVLTIFSANLIAQNTLNSDVQVVGDYQPSISDAFKLNFLPKINDTSKVEPVFDYSVEPKRFTTDFQLEPIKPASMLGEPLSKLYRANIKVGFGNYLTPLFELNYNSLRSKKTMIGVDIKHLSSGGKIKLADDIKVNAGYSENAARIYGKYFLNKKTFSNEAYFNRSVFRHYGYNFENDTSGTIIENGYKQRYMLIEGISRLNTTYTDSSHLNFDMPVKYSFLQDINNINQNAVIFSPKFNQFYERKLFNLDANFGYFNKKQQDTSFDYFLVKITPYASFFGENWKINVGFRAVADFADPEGLYYFYPKVNLEYNVVETFMTTYLGIDGDIEENDYKKIVFENPYILPSLNVAPTNLKINAFGGLRGNFSERTAYNLKLSYSEYDDMYFYVNDSTLLENQFDVVYSEMDLLKISGEFSTKPTDNLNILLRGNFYNYTYVKNIEKPWHKPDYDLTLNARYNLQNKIVVDLDFFMIGKRYAKSYNPSEVYTTLKPIVDLNLGVEYRYTKILSAFVRLNNITASKYYLWNHYPSQRLNFVVGLSYSL